MPRSISYAELSEEKKEEIRRKGRLYYQKNKKRISLEYIKRKEEFRKKAKIRYHKDIVKSRQQARIRRQNPKYKEQEKIYLIKKLKEDPDFLKRSWKKYRSKNKKKRNLYSKEYYQKNSDKIKSQKKEYSKTYTKRPDVIIRKRSYVNNYRKDPHVKIGHQYRVRINHALKSKNLNRIVGKLDFLGCSLREFKIHLEKKFQPGMNWSNYKKDGWHVDHIKPIASFDLTKNEERKKCFHYTNLQPLWAIDNYKKNKY